MPNRRGVSEDRQMDVMIARPVMSAATFQKTVGKQDGALGCRQGRGANDGRCAAREDHRQNRALSQESHQWHEVQEEPVQGLAEGGKS
jgi:hypothetical protein